MRAAAIWIVIAAMAAGCATTGAPPRTPPGPRVVGYTLTGDRVVFAFRAADYESVSTGTGGDWMPMTDLRIHRVAVAGEFNRWSTDAWPMARAGEWWIASHAITELESTRALQFKFVVNGRYWAEPPADAANRATVTDGGRNANLVLQVDRPGATHPSETHAQPPVHR